MSAFSGVVHTRLIGPGPASILLVVAILTILNHRIGALARPIDPIPFVFCYLRSTDS